MSKSDEDADLTQFVQILNRLSAGYTADPRRKPKKSSKSSKTTTPLSGHFGLRRLDPALIETLLTSGTPDERVRGRLFATNLCEECASFVEAEHARGTEIGPVLVALTEVMATYLATLVISNAVSEDAAQLVVQAVSGRFAAYLRQMVDLNTT